MKRLNIAIFVLLILTIAFSACNAKPAPEKANYNGTSEGYVYWYEEGRNRDWEEDVIYLADMFLSNQPQLSNKESRVNTDETEKNVYYSNKLYDEELRNEFIEKTNLLIPQIDELDDFEIYWELCALTAISNDSHSGVLYNSGHYYPLVFESFSDGDTIDFYSVSAEIGNEEFIYLKLVSVNDVPIENIVEKARPYFWTENDYRYYEQLEDLLSTEEFFVGTGVVAEQGSEAEFCFENSNGESFYIVLNAVNGETFDIEMSKTQLYQKYTLMHKNSDKYYWYEVIDENTLYIRINAFREEPLESLSRFAAYIEQEVSDREIIKTIIDLRDNNGGTFIPGYSKFINTLKNNNFGQIYLLTNSGTFSCAVLTSALIKQRIDNVIIVGSPAAQSPNFSARYYYYGGTLPNSKLSFRGSDSYNEFWPDYEYDAFMPDITIYQTIEDYKNGIDTVLETVLAME